MINTGHGADPFPRFHGICRGILYGVCLAFLVQVTACGGSDGPDRVIGPAVPVAVFVDSGTSPVANMVRMTGSASGDIATVSVTITGPTTSTDLYSFAFDLVLEDPDLVVYESGSANLGTALTLSGGQTSQVLAVQTGNRITVGVTKLGGGAGNAVSGVDEVVVSFRFRVLGTGESTLTVEGSPPRDPAAIDSSGVEIPSVMFDAAPAMILGS